MKCNFLSIQNVCIFVMCIMFVGHCPLMKMEYQCLFHVMYEPYINVRLRKFIIVVPMLCKSRRFTFLCISIQSPKPYSLPVLPFLPHQAAYITFAFSALLKTKNFCIYLVLLHLHSAPNTCVQSRTTSSCCLQYTYKISTT